MSKGSIKVAKKYARALLEVSETSQLEAKQAALKSLSKIWIESSELREALKNPALSLIDRTNALKSIVEKIASGDTKFSLFCELLAARARLDLIPAIAESFSAMVMEIRKILAVRVVSASAPSPEEKEQLKAKLQKDFGALASIEWEIDKNLIGGAKVQLGDRLLDGSVRGMLDRLQAELLPSQV